MAVGDELRDPWGWLVAGVSGGLGWAVLATAMGPAAIVAGAGIGAAVLGVKVAVGSARNRDDAYALESAATPRDRLPAPPRGSAQAALVSRSRRAVDRVAALADSPGDPWISTEISRALGESRGLLGALSDLAGRITLLEISIDAASPDQVANEVYVVQGQIARTTDPQVRAELDRALAALNEQSTSIQRLVRRRDALLAQLQTSTIGLEGLATRVGELVALGPVGHDEAEVDRIVGQLTGSLDSVRAGVEEARKVMREL